MIQGGSLRELHDVQIFPVLYSSLNQVLLRHTIIFMRMELFLKRFNVTLSSLLVSYYCNGFEQTIGVGGGAVRSGSNI